MNSETAAYKRLVIVSNRLPFVLEKCGDGWTAIPGSGGLVTALAPVLRNRGGIWIGWPGISESADISELVEKASKDAGFSMTPVMLNKDEVLNYYVGFSNEVIWPLFHDFQSYCNFDPRYWEIYQKINSRFASVIAENASPEDFIWVHDYHHICVATELRKLNVSSRLGFFLHIPFPPLDLFVKLPWRYELLRAMLDYDLIGFQTLRDRRNFTQCLGAFVKNIRTKGTGRLLSVEFEGRTRLVGAFPVSIDYREFSQMARTREVADRGWFIHEDIPDRKIVLGVDRLDYTKGIIYRLKAFARLLEKHPEIHRMITLVQVVVPSRRNIPIYENLKVEIERLVGEINGRFTKSGWVPIHYIFRSLSRTELLAYYRSSEIAIVTPLKDGMNLVAKEYCASSIEQTGALILSEFAGSAHQLQTGAFIVNPYHIDEVADAIYTAFKMNQEELKVRMKKMQKSITRQDIYWWVDSFLNAAISGKLKDFPFLEELSHDTEPKSE